jgi:general secretion pathway protein J
MQGFTLAEILIAIAIFALLVSIVMGSFNGVFFRTEALSIQRSNTEMARACLDRIATDLRNIYVEQPPFFKPVDMAEDRPPHRFAAGTALENTSPRVLLQFASKAHVVPHGPVVPGLAIIRYYTEELPGSADGGLRLRRSDVVLSGDGLPDLQADPILCENIKAIEFTCIDAEEEPHDGWDAAASDNDYATPRAVRIRLELAAPAGPTVFQTTVYLPVWREASGKA